MGRQGGFSKALIPPAPVWRQAARMLIATALAALLTEALQLKTYYWAMITTMTVVQGNIGGSLDAGLTQCLGTVLGGLFGIAGVWARAHHLLPDWLLLLVVLAPLALSAASTPHLRTAPITALIVLLVGPLRGAPMQLAFGRIGEIAIGSAIGILVSILVLPSRATATLRRQLATALRALADQAHSALNATPPNPAHAAAFRAAIEKADAAQMAVAREQALHVSARENAAALLRGVRQLHGDVRILARAAAATPLPAAAESARAWFLAAADSLANRAAPPTPAAFLPADPADEVRRFALEILARDMQTWCGLAGA